MNSVKLSGIVKGDPTIKVFSSGAAKCTFSIENTAGRGDKTRTHIIPCAAWKETAEKIADKYVDGSAIEIEGMLTEEKWDWNGKQYSKTVVVAFGLAEQKPAADDECPF